MQLSKDLFGVVNDQEVFYYTICNNNNVSFTVIEYGATIISVKSKTNDNNIEEMTLCYPSLDDLINNHGPYYGCCVGRVANRIKDGTFDLDGITYNLAVNNGKNHLHGGNHGFDQKIWNCTATYQYKDMAGVELVYNSYDGEENYPGNVKVTVRYELTNLNDLIISYHATTDKATPINLTNHIYWNLSGSNCIARIYDHTLQLSCSKYLPVNKNQIPTGELSSVRESYFDFTTSKYLRDVISSINGGGKPGIDHCFVIDQINTNVVDNVDQYHYNSTLQYDVYQNILKDTNNLTNMVDRLAQEGYLRHIATLSDPDRSGRTLTVCGTQPGVQVYTANWLPPITTDNNNKVLPQYVMHNGICLESQHFPDAINQHYHNKYFTSIILRPEEGPYFHQTVYSFSNLHK